MQMASPILEPKTRNKVKFVYPDNPETDKIMEDLFNMDELECAFGGRSQATFNINDYAARMREDDNKMPLFWSPENSALASEPYVMKNHGNQQCSSGLRTEETALDKIEETENVSEKSEESESTSEEKEENEAASEERGQPEILSEKSRETETGSVKDESETISKKKEEFESSTIKLTISPGEGITSSDKVGSSSDP
jgi:hypothetical protein